MSKPLTFPALSEPLTADSIQTWLTKCEDRVELFGTWNPSFSLTDRTKIMCAADSFDSKSVKLSAFWGSERDTCLGLSWDSFKQRIKSQFLGTDSKVDALQSFFLSAQGRRPFGDFLAEMQAARATLNAYGSRSPFYVGDFLMKSALLFRCHPSLHLRVRSIPSFSLESMSLDTFVSALANTWSALVAEPSFSHLASWSSPSPGSMPTPSSTLSLKALSPLPSSRPISSSEREALKSSGGCFNCGLTPKDPAWKPHGGTPYSRNCPGNQERGIASRNVVAALMPVDQTADVLSFLGFADLSSSSPLGSVSPTSSAVNEVCTSSGADVYTGVITSRSTVAAIMPTFCDDDDPNLPLFYTDDGPIDDDEDDRVFGSDYF
ncbi:hypothetical protein K435DRAFT_475866 [Dendrothele bispora CBS 962.96]|uniref:Retrotransposon gag domain-containing protein n=1 Tax=Dendrothele bispora (strain CBS 962.96) TaxID=1314807 RepID=A0A4S8KZ47_DENBC|nr:hypothetical protein K435DRAFT_475866 [Dendrothele bispora CBS 962.96]